MNLPEIVNRQIIIQYIDLYGSDRYEEEWSLADCLDVFTYFYQQYSERIGQNHPRMKNKTIRDIITRFPYIDDEKLDNREYNITPDEYYTLIDAYFDQDFSEDCNYSMAHFMSGRIRLLRYYEELY